MLVRPEIADDVNERDRRGFETLERDPGSVRPRSARIFIIDDDKVTLETYARALRLDGFEVGTAVSADTAWPDMQSNQPDAIIVDLRMPATDGLEFLQQLRARNDDLRETPVAVVTGDFCLDEATASRLLTLGAQTHFKPVWLEHLSDIVRALLETRR
jgi:DNA-binding response OmpR family regulator